MNTSTEKSRAAIVRLLQELGPEEKLTELEEVIDYLTSYVEDEDADTEGLRITLVGFFEYFEEKEELDGAVCRAFMEVKQSAKQS